MTKRVISAVLLGMLCLAGCGPPVKYPDQDARNRPPQPAELMEGIENTVEQVREKEEIRDKDIQELKDIKRMAESSQPPPGGETSTEVVGIQLITSEEMDDFVQLFLERGYLEERPASEADFQKGLRAFQLEEGLACTGELNTETLTRLRAQEEETVN